MIAAQGAISTEALAGLKNALIAFQISEEEKRLIRERMLAAFGEATDGDEENQLGFEDEETEE